LLKVDQAAIDEVFPNNPLREVAFEIRFPTNLRIMPNIWQVQEAWESEYPQVQREEIQFSTLTSTNYTFTGSELGRVAKVGEDRLAIIFTQYENFESFSLEAIKKTQIFCEMFKIKLLTRVGLRYINNISITNATQDGGLSELSKYTRSHIDIARIQSGSSQLNQFGSEIILEKDGYLLTIRSAFLRNPNLLQEKIYVIDFDASTEKESSPEKIPEILRDLHHHIQLEFLGHITEDYKEEMRGHN